jgi:hypothetical protein
MGMNPGASTIIPATAFAPMETGIGVPSAALSIGSKSVAFPGPASNSAIWLVAVSLWDLSIADSELSDGSSVPGSIAQYAGNPDYFLYAISNNAWASQMPQGALYQLLVAAGASVELARLEQIYAQLSTGFLGMFSYILAASFAENDAPGFELLSMTDLQIMTMGFLELTIAGKTVYAPVQQGA